VVIESTKIQGTGYGWIHCPENNETYKFFPDDIIHLPDHTPLLKNDVVSFFPITHGMDKIAQNMRRSQRKTFQEIKHEILDDRRRSKFDANFMVENTVLDIAENQSFEFKNYQPFSFWFKATDLELILASCDKDLNAFVNSDGGTLFFGITNKGAVKGQKSMTRERQDWIQTSISNRLRSWKVIKPDNTTHDVAVKLDFVEVIRLDKSAQFGYVIPDSCVIRINIKPYYHSITGDQLVFSTFQNDTWIRKLATVVPYRGSDIQLPKAEGYEVDEKTGVNNLILDDLNEESSENPGSSIIPKSTIIIDENKINDNEGLDKEKIVRDFLLKLHQDNSLNIDDEYVRNLLLAHDYNVDYVAKIIQQQLLYYNGPR